MLLGCSESMEETRRHDYMLTPGRYVGAEDAEEDDEAFAEKMQRLTAELSDQFAQSRRLEGDIRLNLGRLGHEI